MDNLTEEDMIHLRKKGWDFLPFGPDEWQWMKFDPAGKRLAIQCDETWKADLQGDG